MANALQEINPQINVKVLEEFSLTPHFATEKLEKTVNEMKISQEAIRDQVAHNAETITTMQTDLHAIRQDINEIKEYNQTTTHRIDYFDRRITALEGRAGSYLNDK